MLVQEIDSQLIRPPVPVRCAGAGHVSERAFGLFYYCVHLLQFLDI
jgi:hypothetical protein